MLDLASGGVGLAPLDGAGLESSAPTLVPPEVRDRIADIQSDLNDGKIVVTEYQP
jgi:hypothetical protein